ncbi:MAG: ATP-binding protein [bacterium]|nr:ATP-binding protein [bacterium]
MIYQWFVRNSIIIGISVFVVLWFGLYFIAGYKNYKTILLLWFVLTAVLSILNVLFLKKVIQPFERLIETIQSLHQPSDNKPQSLLQESLDEKFNQSLRNLIEKLQANYSNIVHQRNELEALLSSMVEGMIAVDNQGYVLRINRAARELFSIHNDEFNGKLLIEVVRNTDLQNFVQKLLTQKTTLEDKIVISKIQKTLQVHGSPLYDTQGMQFGVVLVLNDITRLEKLEKIRREFVSNVSHELKTPITSIRGYVETIREIGFEDREMTIKFLDTILKHTERLSAIIEDLLNLSRIERDEREIEKEEMDLIPILRNLVEELEPRLQKYQIQVEFKVPNQLICLGNKLLLRQAFFNLLDNAIKYAADGKKIVIQSQIQDQKIVLSFQDFGPGIDKKHHERIFERFYRLDVARSRNLGGTGLGLAIVKHVILAHHGNVTLESEVGKGTTFQIHLPIFTPNDQLT